MLTLFTVFGFEPPQSPTTSRSPALEDVRLFIVTLSMEMVQSVSVFSAFTRKTPPLSSVVAEVKVSILSFWTFMLPELVTNRDYPTVAVVTVTPLVSMERSKFLMTKAP